MKRAFILFIFLIFAVRQASAQQTAEITGLKVTPDNPAIFKAATVEIEVTNSGPSDTFLVELFVIREGEIKLTSTFSLTLQTSQPLKITPTFTPDNIGGYEIVVKLWDKNKAILYDTKIINFSVTSDIGPFDLSIDAMTRIINPGDEVPLIIQTINQG